ncbi:MAG: hypothetical protein RL318_1412 [Fibrobacterota bacterium]
MTYNQKKWLGAALVTLVGIIVYTLTMSPTVSFWDCGEYISSAHVLGVGHPPGAPTHAILGRVAILTFAWFADLGARVNFISVLTAAITAGAVYLAVEKALFLVQKGDKYAAKYEWTRLFGATIGGLLTVFNDTFWFSAIEAEMYAPATMVNFICIALMLYWVELRKTQWGDRILAFVVYLSFLGIGFTLPSVMFVPLFALFIVAIDEEKRKSWSLYAVGILIMSVIYMPGMAPFIIMGLVAVMVTLWAFPIGGNREQYKLSFVLALMALLGWSIQAYTPIRATLRTIVNEGEAMIRPPVVADKPETWDNYKQERSFSHIFDLENWTVFQDMIERKQYGSESMITRAMHRRGQILNQLLVHQNMGYGGYMVAQYLPFKVDVPLERFGIRIPTQVEALGVRYAPDEKNVYQSVTSRAGNKRLLAFMLLLIAHLPIYYVIRHTWKKNLPVTLLVGGLYLFAGFGIMWYVNFADGTKPELSDYRYYKDEMRKNPGQELRMPDPVHMEVRVRDYFFTPGFIMVALMYGMAAAMMAQDLKRRKDEENGAKGTGLKFAAFMVLVGSTPILACFSNWKEKDRSNNFVAYDYSYNLLMSCEKDAVLFTNGDNDTFPLWALQYVYGIRPDVRLVNLSLLNTDWYIRQMRDVEPKVPILFSDAEVAALQPTGNEDTAAGLIKVGNYVIVKEGRKQRPYYRVQDIMTLHIVDVNSRSKNPKPINFAATVGDDNFLGLDPYVQMRGLIYSLKKHQVKDRVDVVGTRELFEKTYQFRGLGADRGWMDDDSERLLTNYSSIAIQVAMEEVPGIKALQDSVKLAKDSSASPEAKERAAVLKSVINKRINSAMSLLTRVKDLNPKEWRTPYFTAQFFSEVGRNTQAESTLVAARKRMPNEALIVRAIADMHVKNGQAKRALALYDTALKNPYMSEDGRILEGQAMTLAEVGKYEEALGAVEKAAKTNPNDQRLGMLQQMIQQRMMAARQPMMPGAPAMPSGMPGQPVQQAPAQTADSGKGSDSAVK